MFNEVDDCLAPTKDFGYIEDYEFYDSPNLSTIMEMINEAEADFREVGT